MYGRKFFKSRKFAPKTYPRKKQPVSRDLTVFGKGLFSADARLCRTVEATLNATTGAHYGFSDENLWVNGTPTTNIQGGADLTIFESYKIEKVEAWIMTYNSEETASAANFVHSAFIYETNTAPTLALIQQYETYEIQRLDQVKKRIFKPRVKLSATGGSGIRMQMDAWVNTGDDIPHYGIGVMNTAATPVRVAFKIYYKLICSR